MDVLYVYCFKSVGSYKQKLSRIESLVILYWGINCTQKNRLDETVFEHPKHRFKSMDKKIIAILR